MHSSYCTPRSLALIAGLALSGSAASAQHVTTFDDYNFKGEICVGFSCPDAVYTGDDGIRMVDGVLRVLFEDSSSAAHYPTADWRILLNDENPLGDDYFAIESVDTGEVPFKIIGSAPSNSLYVDPNGYVGLGTRLPVTRLHIRGGDQVALRLEQDSSQGNGAQTWDMISDSFGLSFAFHSVVPGGDRVPVVVRSGAPNDSLRIHSTGDIAMGGPVPDASLHVMRDNGTASLKIEETIASQTARPLMNLTNYGRPDIIMANTATGGEWAFGAGTNFVLKTGAVGSADGDKTRHLRLYGATGNLEITGQIITGGPTCAGGCDAVFSEGYDLPSIQEHAEAMFALGHLPNVGPTAPGQPVNMSEQYGKLLNELEHAHIYIAELKGEIEAMKSDQADEIAKLRADLSAMAAAYRE